MNRTYLLLAGALTALAAPVAAQELTAPIVSTQNSVNWTGFSVGGQIGYLWAETDGAAVLEGEGASFGLRAYYDYDMGNGFVFGGGLQYDSTDIDLEGAATIDAVLRVGARAGISSGLNWYYATAGFARAYMEDGAATVGDSDGYFAGLGYEVLLADQITAGAEILYHEFEDFEDLPGLNAQATTFALSVNYRF